mgnify:FL=1|tara:strand:- start:49397 stop:50395 length:999 start_codon:yes stop_codon:yes gene_type:complete
MKTQSITVCALYHFVKLPHFEDLKAPLLNRMEANQVRGTLLLAQEGINGTIAGTADAVDDLITYLTGMPEFADLSWKLSFDDEMPFYRSRVKLKKEIVTMGVEDIDPNNIVGTYVEPKDWNDVISDPEVMVIDTRNEYEVNIGTFKHAENPHTTTFREFPDYVKHNLNPKKHKKVAMFCTGGIRCEKSTAYLKAQGFEDVYHLKGGILKYLEEVPEQESLWQGECFVFDNRVTVDHKLESGSFDQCHACRMPITDQDKASNAYQKGVSCPHCIETHSDAQRARFRERQHQVQLSKERGESHIGTDARIAQQEHKSTKAAQKAQQRNQVRKDK